MIFIEVCAPETLDSALVESLARFIDGLNFPTDTSIFIDNVEPQAIEVKEELMSFPTGTQIVSLHPESEKNYTSVQFKVSGDNLHIQSRGTAVNRSYGGSCNIPLDSFDDETAEFLRNAERTLPSLTGSGEMYAPMMVRPSDRYQSGLKLQIPGMSGNRPEYHSARVTVDEAIIPIILA
jgi:hypothetical protein